MSELENDIGTCLTQIIRDLREGGMFRWDPGDMEREQRLVAKVLVKWEREISERVQDRIAVACYDDRDQRAYTLDSPEWTENLLNRKIKREGS